MFSKSLENGEQSKTCLGCIRHGTTRPDFGVAREDTEATKVQRLKLK